MKLLTRYSRVNVLATIIIFLVASVAYYVTLKYVLVSQIDEDLRIEESEIRNYVAKYDRLPENFSFKDQLIKYRTELPLVQRHFGTTFLQDSEQHNEEKFRQLAFGIRAGGKSINVFVFKSLKETDALIVSILLITIMTILAILVVSFLINRLLLKRIWQPFYTSLAQMKHFRIGSSELPRLAETSIDEFSFMNEQLEAITRRAQQDYQALKNFSDNASHEIQTPIAIIRSKLDLMIGDEGLTEKQGLLLQSAYNAIERLSRLNQSLLLLARIENRQFETMDVVQLDEKLREKIVDFQELWQARQLKVTYSLSPVKVRMNRELAEVLLNNLLSNATRHNHTGGSICIELQPGSLKVSNTGAPSALDEKRIFQRFYKGTQGNEYNGLGLSIIRQICDASGLKVEYAFREKRHEFTLHFSQ